jgi:uncharacterized membrane protein
LIVEFSTANNLSVIKAMQQLFFTNKTKKILALVCLIITLVSGLIVHTKLWIYDTKAEDIYYTWLEGKRILLGENPYARVLAGNMRENEKYATYFPLFYLLSCLTQLFSWREYSQWVYLWRHIFLVFNLGITSLIFYVFCAQRLFVVAIFSSIFWLFNRWTLDVTKIAHIEFLPIFFLIASLMVFRNNQFISLLLYSISLAFKQIAIFLLPLYLIWAWQSTETGKLRQTLTALGIILSIPVITSLPFIIWNAEGFFKSIAFSATRNPGDHFGANSLDAFITKAVPQFVGIKAKIPMLFLMALIYLTAFQKKIGLYSSSLLTMSIFVDFNSVLFPQYMSWIVPLLPLAIDDFVHSNREIAKEK